MWIRDRFWGDTLWNDVDYMFVDMPPGTGDVALNVFQSLPVDGVLIVASPQDLVSMVVQKAVKMAQMMNIPIVGLVENMSYVQCPDCGKKLYIFGCLLYTSTFDRALLSVRLRASGVPDSHGVTGGVYKARERIHRGMQMCIRDRP